MLLYPSLMGADQLRLAEVISQLEPYCAGFHLDSMDGHLVPNLMGGPAWINAISAYAQKPVWVHLMVTDPVHWIRQLHLKANSMIDFQWQKDVDHEAIIQLIHKMGYRAGISIAPETIIESILPLLVHCDYVSVMGVKPGFSGQSYIPSTTEKIKMLNTYKAAHNLSFFIACDGGIDESLISTLETYGVTHSALASAVFKSENPTALLQKNTH